MTKKEWIKKIIPFVAVLIILESILLIVSLEKNKNKINQENQTKQEVQEKILNKIEPKFEFILSGDNQEMKIGQKYLVTLALQSRENLNIAAAEMYINFDPSLVLVSNLKLDNKMEKPSFMKISEKKNVLVSTILSKAENGMEFVANNKVNLLTFEVTPIKEGITQFEISTGDDDGNSVTMFVDKVTNKALSFSSNKLKIKLVK